MPRESGIYLTSCVMHACFLFPSRFPSITIGSNIRINQPILLRSQPIHLGLSILASHLALSTTGLTSTTCVVRRQHFRTCINTIITHGVSDGKTL